MRSLPASASVAAALLFAIVTTGGCGSPQSGGASSRVAPSPPTTLPSFHEIAVMVPAPPVTLTASDGTGLTLKELSARAIIEEPLALTELHLAFENPQARILEGTFRVTLPHGATVSRFAMKIGEDWQEGEVVELQAARIAYEDFLHKKQDPALLEQGAGNEFTARVFPIPARGVKEIILSYSQELKSEGSQAGYRLPLRGLPELGKLDVAVTIAGATSPASSVREERFVPTADFVLEGKALHANGSPASAGLRSENLVLTRISPMVDTTPDPLTSAVVLFDTSASRALGFADQLRALQRVMGGAGRAANISVACFDQTVELVYEGEGQGFGEAQLQKIRARQALGASDLGQALAWAREQAKKTGAKRVVLISDGVATAGATEGDKLGAAAQSLKLGGIERLDAVAVGGIRDDAALRRLVTVGLARDGVVADGTLDTTSLARRLMLATRSGIQVKVDGASWSYPQKLDGVQAGDEYFVYADVPANRPVTLSIGGVASAPIQLRTVERPLLERAWVQAKISSLVDRMSAEGQSESTQKQIVELSVAHRVLSPYTALLVLETEDDYARFKIDRRSLADILTVDGGRIARGHRAASRLPVMPIAADAKKNDDDEKQKTLAAPSGPPGTTPRPAPQRDTDGRASAADATSQSRTSPASPPSLSPPPPPAPTATAAASAYAPPPSARPSMPVAREESAGARAPERRIQAIESSNGALMRLDAAAEKAQKIDPYTGRFKSVMEKLASRNVAAAMALANDWHREDPGDVMGLIALGEAFEADGAITNASRAYGSIIDLFASRADLRRFAGERLERLRGNAGQDLAIDTFAKAEAQRPDHPSSHRLLAMARLKKGLYAEAFEAAAAGANREYPQGRFPGVNQIMKEDLGLIAAAWIKAEPQRRAEILARLEKAGGLPEDRPSLRFILNWETDANDVDFHILDARGNHAFYSQPKLASGGELYADITTGYGPECFTIRGPKAQRAQPYTLQAHYYSRGPMGYGMGKLEIIDHDGKGGLTFEERPYVVMVDQAFLDLGTAQ